MFTLQDQGSDDTLDSDASPLTGKTGNYVLPTNTNNPTVDAGLYQPASIGDFVWNDLNANGVQDSGEPGIANVPVQLWQPGPDGLSGTGDDIW